MKKRLLWIALLSICLPTGSRAGEHTVLVVEGDKAPKVKPGDVLRFSESAASGRCEISATVEGGATLLSSTNIRRYRDGRPLIGAVTKEFEVKAQKKGTALVKIVVKDLVDKRSWTKEYKLDIDE